jgi:hypothetical protein
MITFFSIERYQNKIFYYLEETNEDGYAVRSRVSKDRYYAVLHQLAKGAMCDQYKRFEIAGDRGVRYYYIPHLPKHLQK